MSKKIGFRSYQNDEEPDKRDELEKQQAERQKAIANFIGQNYSPIGTTSQKCYKTTAEHCRCRSDGAGQTTVRCRVPCRIFGRTTLLGDVRESINSCGCTSFCTNLYKSVQPHLFDK